MSELGKALARAASNEPEPVEGKDIAADAVFDAFHAKDKRAFREALESFVRQCHYEHDEGEET